MGEFNNDKLGLKAMLLELESVQISDNVKGYITERNLNYDKYVFVKLDPNSRVRLRVVENSNLNIGYMDDKLELTHKGALVKDDIVLEKTILESPNQINICLYHKCKYGCAYCPLPHLQGYNDKVKEEILKDISENHDKGLESISFTYGIPYGFTDKDIVTEIVDIVKSIRKEFGSDIPIGVGPFAISDTLLNNLYSAGVNEVRVNIETYNRHLFDKLCPKKKYDEIKKTLLDAVSIFGRNKVSSNIILGLSETDEDIIEGIVTLTEVGVLPTLHPLDTFRGMDKQLVPILQNNFGRPKSERLKTLAIEHKNAIETHNINPFIMKTSCAGCSACGIMPVRDL